MSTLIILNNKSRQSFDTKGGMTNTPFFTYQKYETEPFLCDIDLVVFGQAKRRIFTEFVKDSAAGCEKKLE